MWAIGDCVTLGVKKNFSIDHENLSHIAYFRSFRTKLKVQDVFHVKNSSTSPNHCSILFNYIICRGKKFSCFLNNQKDEKVFLLHRKSFFWPSARTKTEKSAENSLRVMREKYFFLVWCFLLKSNLGVFIWKAKSRGNF